MQASASTERPGITPQINHVILTLIWVYSQEQELQYTICNLCDTLPDLMKPVWTVSYRWGTAVGGLFFDTTLQGADQGSQSLPNSHTLNSSHQNGSRRKSCRLYQCWAASVSGHMAGVGGGVSTFSRWSSVSTMVAARMSMGFLLSTASTFIPIWKPWRGRWTRRPK